MKEFYDDQPGHSAEAKEKAMGKGKWKRIETRPSSSSDDEIYPPSEDEAPCARNGGSKGSLYHSTGGRGEAAGAAPATGVAPVAATDEDESEDDSESESESERGPARKKRGILKVCRGSCKKSFTTWSNIRKH